MKDVEAPSSYFELLRQLWPDLHGIATEAAKHAEDLPGFAAIRLRSYAEVMVQHLFEHHDIASNEDETQLDRLRHIEKARLVDQRALARFHVIRKLGNVAAHDKRPITRDEACDLVKDASSLAYWFCRHMRPDINWAALLTGLSVTTRAGELSPDNQGVEPETEIRPDRSSGQALKPALLVRPPQTRMSLSEMFEDELTADQQRCIEALDGFLANDSQRIFLLKGYAGTGKTFLASGLTEFLLTRGRTFSLAAPTGRAAKVIATKTGQSARTIHSLIYDYSDMTEQADHDDDGSATFKMIAKVRNNQDPIDAVVIIDEASLASNVYSESEFFRSGSGHLLQDLIAYVGSTHSGNARKIIFIGDPAQLPPVGMSTSPALDAEYLREKFGLDATGYELTEIVRQKAESAVLRNVLPLREGVVSGQFSSLSFSFDDDVIRLLKDSVTPHYVKIRAGRGPQAPIIITHSNAEAATFNRAIRAVLFPGMPTVAAGDSVIVAANGFCGAQYIANGEILRIVDVESTVERRSVRLLQKVGESDVSEPIDVSMNFRDVLVALPLPDADDLILKAKILDDFLHGDEAGLSSAQQRALYVDFLKRHSHINRKTERDEFQLALRSDPYFNALRLRFGYAITCHKAQGGEWSHVIVSCATRQNPRSSDYFRWLYTAMTRTSDKLYLVDPPDVRITEVPQPDPNKNAPSLLTQVEFRQWLQDEIRVRLAGAEIEIEDIAHHQYREAYFFKRGTDAVRIDIGYRGNWAVSGVTCPRPDGFAEEIMARLAELKGQQPGPSPVGADSGPVPDRPFLRAFHDRLLAALANRGVKMISLKEQQWSQRYVLARGSDAVTVDIFYNGRNQLTRFMLINPPPKPASSLVDLQDDVRTVLTVEVRP